MPLKTVHFNFCFSAQFLTRQINLLINRTMFKVEPEYDDNMVTCSQMVYDCYASKPNQVRFLFYSSTAPQDFYFM